MAGAPAAPDAALPAAPADEASAERAQEHGLEEHLRCVARHLREQLHAFGELDLALSELSELGGRCRGLGVGAEVLEALDSALLASEDCEGVACELGLDAGGDAESAALRAEVLACAGDYFALFRRPELAKAQHEAALKEDEGCLAALLGAARAEAELNSSSRVESALRCCWRAAELAASRGGELREGAPQFERQASECFHLLDGAVELDATPRALQGLPELLARSVPLLATPAASAIESLSRRCLAPAPWLEQPLDAVDAVEAPLPDLVVALLLHSEAFCHVTLERHVVRWRAALCGLLHAVLLGGGQEECGGAPRPLPELLPRHVQDAAAIACHLHFVGYCVPLADDEATVEASKLEAAKRLDKPGRACGGDGAEVQSAAAWLLVSMYENPRADPPEALPNYGVAAVAALAARCFAEPREEAALLQSLQVLRPDGSLSTGAAAAPGDVQHELPDTPCRTFYDETVYPAWHEAVESAGVLPATIDERLARLFPWRETRPASGGARRVLVAGCGSGHQVAVELRTYLGCQVVALDCAPRSVAYAQRKLRRALSSEEFARVSFVVGDILELKPGSALAGPGFDLVVCCGVLHHLRRPAEGLQRLAGVLAPGGVLQLSTYSPSASRAGRPPCGPTSARPPRPGPCTTGPGS
ncbi:unnamed protein product [Prorocentrum cordatum]|uniref:Methyltransferase type 12 domain-containing protein n=1 Tax=Prorocentrum cordatum TaxID=2364126 RepID=A0ABN9VER8_9DINO|nr:unnamed protein product [Polarella glacialis]